MYTARLTYNYPELVQSMGYLPAPSSVGLVRISPGESRPPLSGIPQPPSPSSPPGNRYVNWFHYSDLNNVFNLTNYGTYIKPWLFDERLNYQEAITSLEEFAGFCDEVAIVGPLFACSLAGAILVLLDLTLFTGSLSEFYTRLKLTKELTDFKQRVALRSPKNHNHAAYF
ncbi:Myelin proteolipid [Fasciola gigantica]|uniref:Myelin proteolipid n=1 Tax=Fasciola gigantica TaxID=46835 RepID=A0A504Z241_FASGI|nr:Myelin proteolipid [Fasciola gigantica]